MSTYLFPIHTAVLFFPLIAFLLTLPYMFYSYHRYGAVSWLRSLVLGSFMFYLLCAYFLVILPLPDRASVAHNKGPFMQLIPFTFVREFLANTKLNLRDIHTYLPALKQGVFIQPLFNLVLTVPFGAYLSYYFKQNLRRTLLFSFLLSLFFEITQLTGLYCIYPKPYRLFDVDDLFLNTLGGFLGYFLGIALSHILPSKERIDRSSLLKSDNVGYLRRLSAAIPDLIIATTLSQLIDFFLPVPDTWPFAVAYILYFIVLPLCNQGRTLGKMFVHLRIMSTEETQSQQTGILMRYGLLALPWIGLQIAIDLLASRFPFAPYIGLALLACIPLFIFYDWVQSFRRGKRLWYERISRTENQSYIRRAASGG